MNENKYDLGSDLARVIDDSISELMLYTRKPEKEILEQIKLSLSNRNEEWKLYSQESILNFHRSTEASIFCLTKWNSEKKYQEVIKYISYICKKKGGKILDFGGGTGELTIYLASQNMNVDFLEVPGKTLSFAKWRFKRRFLDITSFTSLNYVGKYDVIICLDVLETLEKPIPHLQKFYQLLNPDGMLILSTGEVGSPLHPMNLEQNKAFLKNINKHCSETGFIDSVFENKFHLVIKQKP